MCALSTKADRGLIQKAKGADDSHGDDDGDCCDTDACVKKKRKGQRERDIETECEGNRGRERVICWVPWGYV